jgi:hypothetical protein
MDLPPEVAPGWVDRRSAHLPDGRQAHCGGRGTGRPHRTGRWALPGRRGIKRRGIGSPIEPAERATCDGAVDARCMRRIQSASKHAWRLRIRRRRSRPLHRKTRAVRGFALSRRNTSRPKRDSSVGATVFRMGRVRRLPRNGKPMVRRGFHPGKAAAGQPRRRKRQGGGSPRRPFRKRAVTPSLRTLDQGDAEAADAAQHARGKTAQRHGEGLLLCLQHRIHVPADGLDLPG